MLFADWPKQHFLHSTSDSEWVHLAWGIFGHVSIFVYCLFGVSTLSNQRRNFISSRPIKLLKQIKIFKISKFQNLIFFKKIKIFKKFQNFQKFHKISKFLLYFKILTLNLVNDWLTSAVGLCQSIIDQVRIVMSRPH